MQSQNLPCSAHHRSLDELGHLLLSQWPQNNSVSLIT